MNSLFTTGLGLTIRLIVDASTSHRRVGACIVGLFEGIILYHSRPGTPSFNASSNPYAAYALRIIFLDLLYTRSFFRMLIVVLWTGLGVILADILEYVSYDGDSARSQKTQPTPKDKAGRSYKPIEPVTEHRRHSRAHRSSDLPGPSRKPTRPNLSTVTPRVDPFSPHLPSDIPNWSPFTPAEVAGGDHDLLSSTPLVEDSVDLLQSPPFEAVDVDGAIDPLNLDDSTILVEHDDKAEVPIVDITGGGDPPPDSVSVSLAPGQQNAPSQMVSPEDADSIPAAGIPLTLASEQSPELVVQNVTELGDQNDVESDEAPPPDAENAIPLPIPTHDNPTTDQIDTNVTNVADISVSIDTPLSPAPKNRTALLLEARVYRAKAIAAEKDMARFETERKLAKDEGRKRDSILREGERYKMAGKAAKYHEKAAERFHMADNIDLPPGIIDVRRSPLPQAIEFIKERYRLMLKNGEAQLRVIVPPDPTSELRKYLQNQLKVNRIPYFMDPYRNQLVLTVPK